MLASQNLDATQRRVVNHDGSPLHVAGGAGTGKTLVLTERWLRLATQSAPHRVLLVTASRREAQRLQNELPWRLPHKAIVEVPVHTCHALAYHLVTRFYRTLGFRQPPTLLTGAEQWSFVRELLEAENANAWGRYAPHVVSTAFVDEVAAMCLRRETPAFAAAAAFSSKYFAALTSSARVDAALLLDKACELLEGSPDITAAVHRRFPHVLVDDAHLLDERQQRLLACFAQDNLVTASRSGTSASIHLETCYRFGTQIGAVATRLQSPGSSATFAGPEGTAAVHVASTFGGEIEHVARQLRAAHLHDQIDYEDMAVLLCTPAALAPLRRALDGLGVPWHAADGSHQLSAQPAVRAIVDLARWALDDAPGDDVVAAALSTPLAALATGRVRELRREAFVQSATLAAVVDVAPDCMHPRALVELVRRLADAPADETFAALYEASSWCNWAREHRFSDPVAADTHAALYALAAALARFVQRRGDATLRDWLASSARAGSDTVALDRDGSGVHLTSLAAAAGREWELVCVLGVTEGALTPSRIAHGLFESPSMAAQRAQASADVDRDLLFQAVTRARTRLLVTCSPGLSGRAAPARLLNEAFDTLDEPVEASEREPLTMQEAVAALRRTLASGEAAERAGAAAALASIPGVATDQWWWTREWTDGAPLTPEGKLTTSYSRIGNYENCPLRYVLESVLGLDPESTYQMKFGSLIHRCIERVERGEITAFEDMDAAFKAEFDHRDYPSKVFARTYWRSGRKMLNFWWNAEHLRKGWKTVAVEYAFNDLEVDGHIIRGRIDRVAAVGRDLYLIDYKTARRAASREEAKSSLQLAIYYQAALTYDDLTVHGTPAQMQLVYPSQEVWREPDQMLRRTQDPADAEATLVTLREILHNAASEQFEPSATADCGWCRMRPLCPRYPEGKDTGP